MCVLVRWGKNTGDTPHERLNQASNPTIANTPRPPDGAPQIKKSDAKKYSPKISQDTKVL